MAEENQEISNTDSGEAVATGTSSVETAANNGTKRAHRSQKVGAVVSDKMLKTVVVRVDRLVRHTKYRRYVRRTSKFMAHDELGATIGDKVRIVETRPMSAKKRWRVIEIVQKAAK
jgi:small subunit ribosomal protein S17